jgi:hypothetical protein
VTTFQASLGWLACLALLAITAGQSWQSFEVSESAGGGDIHISGFLAFPVIGTLISLQVVTILISFLVKPLITRILAGSVLPILVWNFIDVLLNSLDQIQSTVMRVLADQTGVFEEVSTSEFLVSSSDAGFTGAYLFTLALNGMALAYHALVGVRSPAIKSTKNKSQHPEDLWGSQN